MLDHSSLELSKAISDLSNLTKSLHTRQDNRILGFLNPSALNL